MQVSQHRSQVIGVDQKARHLKAHFFAHDLFGLTVGFCPNCFHLIDFTRLEYGRPQCLQVTIPTVNFFRVGQRFFGISFDDERLAFRPIVWKLVNRNNRTMRKLHESYCTCPGKHSIREEFSLAFHFTTADYPR